MALDEYSNDGAARHRALVVAISRRGKPDGLRNAVGSHARETAFPVRRVTANLNAIGVRRAAGRDVFESLAAAGENGDYAG
jgi:hypothetical protein